MILYLIGSLRNLVLPRIAADLRNDGHEVFDDWYAAGPFADDHWKLYEETRGHGYIGALKGHAAQHVYRYDRRHLDRVDGAVLVLPCGRSGHLELGYVIGRGGKGYILLDPSVDRWDVMYAFADGVYASVDALRRGLCQT